MRHVQTYACSNAGEFDDRETAMTTTLFTRTSTFFLFCIVYAFLWVQLCFDHNLPAFNGIDIGKPIIDITPAPINVLYEGFKDVQSCGRTVVSGVSRLKLQHYASMYNITLAPSATVPKKWHNKIQVCFHRNSSLGLCQCGKDDWISLQNGVWIFTMSPYEQKYVDVKFGDMFTGSVTVTLEEVQQRWRYILLAVGIVLLFLAPVLSEWVPFYYTSSIIIGILTVVLIILYQARILLPTGRRNFFYLGIMCSLIGAGSFVVHLLSAFLNSVLLNFGLTPEIQNLVYYFVGLGIFLLGAALGYWLLRKYFVSEDGEVYAGVAQFVKWSMRIVAVTCIFLSTNDNPLAFVVVGSCLVLFHVTAKLKWLYHQPQLYSGRRILCAKSKKITPKRGHAEFFSQSKKTSPLGSPCSGPINSFRCLKSPVKGVVSPSKNSGSQCDYYSTFHNTPSRKKFSEEEWEEFTEESTRQSVSELASSPEFTDWVINNADRILLLPKDTSDGSESDTTETRIASTGLVNVQLKQCMIPFKKKKKKSNA